MVLSDYLTSVVYEALYLKTKLRLNITDMRFMFIQ